MKFHFEVFGIEFGLITGIRRKLKQPIAGITNRTQDGFYVLFLDYDEIPFDWLLGELEDIQNKYNLNDIYVFQSGTDKFHVVGFDKLTREQYQEILARSSCDPNYKKVPFTWGRRVATLRVTEKEGRGVKLYSIIRKNAYSKTPYELSNAHRMFFEKIYNITAPEGDYDDNEEIIMAQYRI